MKIIFFKKSILKLQGYALKIQIEKNYHMEENINSFLKNNNITLPQYLNKFSYKNIKDKKWINFVYEDNKIDILMDILKYLRVKDPDRLYSIDKNIMYKSKNDIMV